MCTVLLLSLFCSLPARQGEDPRPSSPAHGRRRLCNYHPAVWGATQGRNTNRSSLLATVRHHPHQPRSSREYQLPGHRQSKRTQTGTRSASHRPTGRLRSHHLLGNSEPPPLEIMRTQVSTCCTIPEEEEAKPSSGSEAMSYPSC